MNVNSRKITKEINGKENEGRALNKAVERPTFILKTREGDNRAVSPNQRNGSRKDIEPQLSALTKPLEPKAASSLCPELSGCIKFMDENMQICESALDFFLDQQDFLVVGCLGLQGVGKSTILSLLTSNHMSDTFPVQNLSHHESGSNCTNGIDFYVTKNRVIYLDTQPILSGSVMDYSTTFEQKKNTNDFVNTETNLELQSLQYAAFLFSVCHVIVFIQDWFVDPNLIRFMQAAEMLKPSSTTSMDQEYIEYYPHILFLHNKAEMQDFLPSTIEMMKEFYNKAFTSSRLQTHSSLDMTSCTTEGRLNLFLIPSFSAENEPSFHENEKHLIEKLRRKIHGIARNPMTPSALTEKNCTQIVQQHVSRQLSDDIPTNCRKYSVFDKLPVFCFQIVDSHAVLLSGYHYAAKVTEAIKKSHLSSEYGRLMP